MRESAPLRVPLWWTGLRPWMPALKRGGAILMYHKLGAPPPDAQLRSLYVAAPLFERQLAELAQRRVATVSPLAAAAPPSAPRVSLTFDDAYRSVHELGLPLLVKHGAQALTYVVAGLVGGRNDWDIADGYPAEALMDRAQLGEWLAAGQRIGSHGMTHCRLTDVNAQRAWEEISASKRALEDRFGVEVADFCYPYGAWNRRLRDLVERAGYRSATTTDFGLATTTADPLALKRILARNRSFAPKLWLRRNRIEFQS